MSVSWDERNAGGILDRSDLGAAPNGRWSGADSEVQQDTVRRRQHARLGRAVEADIIPRLLLGHRQAPVRAVVARHWTPSAANVVELAECAVGDADAAGDYVAAMRASGADVEAVYLDLLGPAARLLGDLWVDDRLSFADVTIGVLRLHQVLRALGPQFRPEAAVERPNRRALLVPGPGEHHSFGLAIVTEFFRRAGWGVWSGTPRSLDETLGLVRSEWFGVVGFSVGCDARLEALASCIRRVRAASRNPAIGVMVGGPIFVLHPELAQSVGADVTATDGRHAAFQAEGLLALQSAVR